MGSQAVTPGAAGTRTSSALLGLCAPAIVLLFWVAVTASGAVTPYLLPSPAATAVRVYQLFISGRLWHDVCASLLRWAYGFALGCLLGAPVGLLLGYRPRALDAMFPLLDFLRSLPVTALFPLFLLVFGIGEASKVAMAFTATVFVVILNSASGAAQTSRTRLRMAAVFGASAWQRFRHVVFWEALPQVLVGMRTALSLALIVVIVSEMFIGTQEGIGQRIYDSYSFNLTTDLYALLLVTGLLGFAMNRVFLVAERRIVFWTGR
jgi:ABC-type nitrate/sulfonate/bicarbonate transport system permease component